MFLGGVIWWAAHQDSSISEIKKNDMRISSLESRTAMLESGIAQLQFKLDAIMGDVNLIKGAVIK